jgi:hypothetical protein
MRRIRWIVIFAILAAAVPPALADARTDLRIEDEKDENGNVLYELVNTGDRNIKATVRHTKTCSSTTNRREPTEREYWLGPKGTKSLRKVMANSDCRHEFRIVRAEYY